MEELNTLCAHVTISLHLKITTYNWLKESQTLKVYVVERIKLYFYHYVNKKLNISFWKMMIVFIFMFMSAFIAYKSQKKRIQRLHFKSLYQIDMYAFMVNIIKDRGFKKVMSLYLVRKFAL